MFEEQKYAGKPCWLCQDFKNGECTQESIIMRANRPCGQLMLQWLEDHFDKDPFTPEGKESRKSWRRAFRKYFLRQQNNEG